MANQKEFPKMHVSLYVSDIASTVNFYTTFFGMPASKVKKGYAKCVPASKAKLLKILKKYKQTLDI